MAADERVAELAAAKQALNALLKQIRPQLDAVPRIRRLVTERDRAASERYTSAMADLAYNALKRKVDEFYARVNRLNREALRILKKELRGLLTESEVHSLSRRIDLHRPNVADTYDCLHKAAERLAVAESKTELQPRWHAEVEPAGDTPAKPLPKKRGRPTSIPADRKEKALQAKAQGKSNAEVAKVLYDTPYPSLQQVKNVPTHLKYYQTHKAQARTLNK